LQHQAVVVVVQGLLEQTLEAVTQLQVELG
jgi:hypothetical protein